MNTNLTEIKTYFRYEVKYMSLEELDIVYNTHNKRKAELETKLNEMYLDSKELRELSICNQTIERVLPYLNAKFAEFLSSDSQDVDSTIDESQDDNSTSNESQDADSTTDMCDDTTTDVCDDATTSCEEDSCSAHSTNLTETPTNATERTHSVSQATNYVLSVCKRSAKWIFARFFTTH